MKNFKVALAQFSPHIGNIDANTRKMVEQAKAHNPFGSDSANCCPHMARLGICLEPAMCFLIHKVSDLS